MKLVTLNTWGGLAGEEKLLSFFEKYKDEVDIFCLQEIWAGAYKELDGKSVGGRNLEHDKIMMNGLQSISKTLSGHSAYFRPHFMEHYGLLIYIKKNIKILDEGEVFVHKHKGYMPEGDVGGHARNIQYITLDTENGLKTIINFHGLWNGKGKGDSEDRLTQSDKIVGFISKLNNHVVFCGDFNLLPETESIKKFEDIGLTNLIKEHGVTSTRTSLYDKSIRYADYVFVSKDLKVVDFRVLPEEVSDHNALLLDFN